MSNCCAFGGAPWQNTDCQKICNKFCRWLGMSEEAEMLTLYLRDVRQWSDTYHLFKAPSRHDGIVREGEIHQWDCDVL